MAAQHIPAYLLHARKYTDSRIIIDALTKEFGLISGVYRLKSRKNITSSVPSFAPLLISWGKGNELKSIYDVEVFGPAFQLQGDMLFAAMYVNELLLRVAAKDDGGEDLYCLYEQVLHDLAASKVAVPLDIEAPLRRFELQLLKLLGYGISFTQDTHGKEIVSEGWYWLDPELGFTAMHCGDDQSDLVRHASEDVQLHKYAGHALRSIADYNFGEKEVRYSAKRICRSLLRPILGDKPLKSRELFSR